MKGQISEKVNEVQVRDEVGLDKSENINNNNCCYLLHFMVLEIIYLQMIPKLHWQPGPHP